MSKKAAEKQDSSWRAKAVLFLASQGVTLFGSSLVQFAIVWYVTLQTSSGVWVSVLTAAAYVPQFAVSFFSGVWADRYPRKRIIILADGAIAAATLLLAVLMPFAGEGPALLTALAVISAVRSLGAGIQSPAVGAVIPQLVPETKLMKFNGVNSAIQSLVQFAAPAAAGAVLSFSTLRSTLMIDVVTAVVGIGLLATVAIPFTKNPAAPSAFSDLKDGFRYAVKESFIGPLLLFFGLFIFLCVPAGFLATLFVSRYYGDTYWHLTLVEVIGFIGMTGGGVLIGAWGGFRNRVKTLVCGMSAFGVLAVAMGATQSFPVYLILMAIYGVALTMVQTASTTLLQENTAPEMQGRMFGLFGAIYSGFLPLGMAVFGPLSDVMSMRRLMILSGALLLALAAAIALKKGFFQHGAAPVSETTSDHG
ncbi:MAG: MFS transporter [Oscillospiraceae bacterium]|nr:MFS transporter [Oscillospiraceae bacterium]